MYHRSHLSVVTLCQFLKALCLFLNLEYSTFLLHASTYWVEILHMTLFKCTTDQVWVQSLCINFERSYAFFNLEYRKYMYVVFRTFLLLVWQIKLKVCIWLCFNVLYRSSLRDVTFCQFLKKLCHFSNLEYRKYAVFRTSLLHASTYWAEILHMTLC